MQSAYLNSTFLFRAYATIGINIANAVLMRFFSARAARLFRPRPLYQISPVDLLYRILHLA